MSKAQAKIQTGWSPHSHHAPNASKQNGAQLSPRSKGQEKYLNAMGSHNLVFATGPAGTGKTYLAAAFAASALMSGAVKKIIMSRPALEAGEKLGFLPGDIKEKINPYLRPLYDALGQVLGDEAMQRYMQADLIEIAPLAFMRGRQLANAFVILDEAQNCTAAQMKMFLTRLGEGSTFVICGDNQQSDLPKHSDEGLPQALKVLAELSSVAIVRLGKEDIQRSALVADIVGAYEKEEQNE